jgi:hemoglobin-like flavoprotein
MAKPLTRDQIKILKRTFRKLDTEWVAAEFYRKLFTRHPEVKPLFPTDMIDLGKKLMSVFELIVFSFEEKQHNQFELQDPLIVPLRDLGRKHEEKGVKPEHYAIANGLLLETLCDAGKDDFTSEVKESWRLALAHLTHAMNDKSIQLPASRKSSGKTLGETFSKLIQKLKRESH